MKGLNFIGFSESGEGKEKFKAFAPNSNQYLPEDFTRATEIEFRKALALAEKAFESYQEISGEQRAQFLDSIADEIVHAGDALIERCSAETGLPAGRITNERGRTCGQLKLFASLLREGWFVDARIDTADPERAPLPKPDIRKMLIPIGTVAVFGSSNFPLAFSTAGGDTASALAAGCPVIVKAHSSHPGTNEIIASAIVRAALNTGMPEGVFSSLYLSHEDSVKLVQHPVIKAVGFTGSRKVGMTLFNAAVQREEPIPVFAEMSSVNPVIILEGALKSNTKKIAEGLVASMTLGVGQFCTNPGIVLLKEDPLTDGFLDQLSGYISKSTPGTMLNKNICKSYSEGVQVFQKEKGVEVISMGTESSSAERNEAQPIAFKVNVENFLANHNLSQEIFGPALLIVTYKNTNELIEVLKSFEGQLTATVHADSEDEELLSKVVKIISQKAGRVIYNGFPTGVEVGHAMQHGGPFPSTTDSRSTSVGTSAIYRFLRPVAFQNFPDHLIPQALQNSNPLNIVRLVNGQWANNPIS